MNIPKVQRLTPRVRFPFGARGAVFSIMAVGLAGAMVTAFTGAVFTDTATSTGNVFTSGSKLDLKLTDNNETLQDDVTASLGSTPVLALAGATQADPTHITTALPHQLHSGDKVTIAGSDAVTAAGDTTINHSYTVTVVNATEFTIPVNVTTAGTAVGTVTSLANMLPGDTVYGVIKVKNTNNYQIRFASTSKLSSLPAASSVSALVADAVTTSITGNTSTGGAGSSVVTDTGHGYSVGDLVAISGMTGGLPAAVYQISSVTTNTFTVPVTGAVTAGTGGVATRGILVTSAAHGLNTGDYAVISGTSGTCSPTINGTVRVTEVSTSTFYVPVNATGCGTGAAGSVQPTLTAFGQALKTNVWDMGTTDDDTCKNVTPTGTQVVTNGAFAPNDTSAVAFIGDVTPGSQAGDVAVNPGVEEVLCIKITLPSTAGNDVAGESNAVDWSFVAEQTANNS